MSIQQLGLMSPNGQTAGDAAALVPWSVSDTSWAPKPAIAQLTFEIAGTITANAASSVNPGAPNWYYGGGVPARWIRATVTDGAFTSGPASGVWTALSSAVTWALSQSSAGSSGVSFDIDIASDALGTTIVSSSSGWSLAAEQF